MTSTTSTRRAAALSETAQAQARDRVAALATPAGALGRLADAAVWLSAAQGVCPPRRPADIRGVVFAGDHGVAHHGVTSYPAEVTAIMVRSVHEGTAGVAVLARENGVSLRVVDISVATTLAGVPDSVSRHHLGGASGAIHLADAAIREDIERAIAVGGELADEDIDNGAELLIAGDLGIGNTTASSALIAVATARDPAGLVGRGAGLDDDALARKQDVVRQAVERAGARVGDPIDRLAALGGLDLAAHAGYLARAAERGVPVVLDGVISLACATVARDLVGGAERWFAAGHRSPEPAVQAALELLGLAPLLDLGLRLGEGSGAVAAVPLVRAAAALLSETALLADVLPSA